MATYNNISSIQVGSDIFNLKTGSSSRVSFSDVTISGTPTALGSYQSWDTNQEYGYYLDVTLSGITSTMMISNFVVPTDLMEVLAPYVETGTNKITLYLSDSTAISSTLISLVAEEV